MSASPHRYWLSFEPTPYSNLNLGVGVTAWTSDDAVTLAKGLLGDLPDPISIEEDVDVRALDQGHVIPNMGQANLRGVWFPNRGAA